MSRTPARIEIVDLGAPQEEPAGQVALGRKASRRGGAKAAAAAAAALVILAVVYVSQTGGQESPEAGETAAKRQDVCQEVERANDAELGQEELSSDSKAGPAAGKGYSLLGAWPAGSEHPVTYGRLYPDQSIEICGKPEDLADLGITSSVRQDELGELSDGMSYAFGSPPGSPVQELELLGVRLQDGSISERIVLPDGSIRPLTQTVQGEAVPSSG